MAGNTIWEHSHMYTLMYIDKSNYHIIRIYNIVGGYSESVKLICQTWNLFQIGGETKHIWNHQYINQEWVPQHCHGPIAPITQVRSHLSLRAKLPQLHPHMKHAWHPWNSKISSLLAWAIALWHRPAAKQKRGRDEHVMKDCVKSMCTYHLQSYESYMLCLYLGQLYFIIFP